MPPLDQTPHTHTRTITTQDCGVATGLRMRGAAGGTSRQEGVDEFGEGGGDLGNVGTRGWRLANACPCWARGSSKCDGAPWCARLVSFAPCKGPIWSCFSTELAHLVTFQYVRRRIGHRVLPDGSRQPCNARACGRSHEPCHGTRFGWV